MLKYHIRDISQAYCKILDTRLDKDKVLVNIDARSGYDNNYTILINDTKISLGEFKVFLLDNVKIEHYGFELKRYI